MATSRAVGVAAPLLAHRLQQAGMGNARPMLESYSVYGGSEVAGFVELEMPQVLCGGMVTARIQRANGEQLHIEGSASEVSAVTRALWQEAPCCS